MPTTVQPRRAAAIAALPLPVATSSTRSVEWTSSGLDQELGDEQDLGPDHVVVAARPGRLLALLDGGEVGPIAMASVMSISVLMVGYSTGSGLTARPSHRRVRLIFGGPSCYLRVSSRTV